MSYNVRSMRPRTIVASAPEPLGLAAVTDDVKDVTGRDPIAFAQFVKENAECWEG